MLFVPWILFVAAHLPLGGRVDAGKLTVSVAGTTCTAFSRRGGKQGTSHVASTSAFITWTLLMRKQQTDFVFHECTEDICFASFLFRIVAIATCLICLCFIVRAVSYGVSFPVAPDGGGEFLDL